MSRIVFTNGCFDVLTPMHFNLLLRCNKWAGVDGKVIVALDTDQKIKNDKGNNRPIFSLSERIKALGAIEHPYASKYLVDTITSFNTNTELYDLIKTYKPDIMIKGSDWKDNVVGSDLVQEVIFMDRDNDFSSSKTIEKILLKNKKTHSFDFDPTI